MDRKRQKIGDVEASVLGFIINEIRGAGFSDQTIFYFEGGSVRWTEPTTPDSFLGNIVFRKLKNLPREKKYTGQMFVDRQGGEVKSISFS